MAEDKLVKVKAGIKGAEVEFELSKEAPGVLAGLFPTSAIRSQTRRMLTGQILGKLGSGQLINDAELEYLDNVLKPAEAKLIRQRSILERAAQILETAPPRATLPPHDEAKEKHSAVEDWLAKFWDDAGLVSDEHLREIYARLLVAEASSHGSCSIKTLKALRYLDAQTAIIFSRAIPLVFGKQWLPKDDNLLKSQGLNYGDILELADADLMRTSDSVLRLRSNDEFYSWGKSWIRLENGANFTFPVYGLTRAGVDICRIAQVDRNLNYLRDAVNWLKTNPGMKDLRVSLAIKQNDIDTDDEILRKLDWKLI